MNKGKGNGKKIQKLDKFSLLYQSGCNCSPLLKWRGSRGFFSVGEQGRLCPEPTFRSLEAESRCVSFVNFLAWSCQDQGGKNQIFPSHLNLWLLCWRWATTGSDGLCSSASYLVHMSVKTVANAHVTDENRLCFGACSIVQAISVGQLQRVSPL